MPVHSDTVYDLFRHIESTGGTNAKKRLLHTMPEARTLLKYTYDKSRQYYIRNLTLTGHGINSLGGIGFALLDSLHDRRITGNAARRKVIDYAHNLSPKSATLFNQILNRDLRMGLGIKSINEVFPGCIPTFDVMLAQKADLHNIRWPWFSSVKLDGVRGIYREGTFYTRSGKTITGLDHLLQHLEGAPTLDGELIIPNSSFDAGSGRIRSLDKTPTAQYHIFDMPDERDSFENRLQEMNTYVGEHVMVVDHTIVQSPAQAIEHYDFCRAAGFEGTVLKPLDYTYEERRSKSWQKLKAILSEDLVCIGFYEGTGKYKGSLGGIEVDYAGKTVRVGGGFSDTQRHMIWANPNTYKGVKAEVLFQEQTGKGSVRHPRFLRWRADK